MNNQPLSIITFPIWWYSEGLQLAFRHCQSRWRFVLRSTGLLIFLRNMTQPLYGDFSRSGRIISFFIRVVLLVAIIIWTGIRLVFTTLIFVLYVIALPAVLIMIIYQLFPA